MSSSSSSVTTYMHHAQCDTCTATEHRSTHQERQLAMLAKSCGCLRLEPAMIAAQKPSTIARRCTWGSQLLFPMKQLLPIDSLGVGSWLVPWHVPDAGDVCGGFRGLDTAGQKQKTQHSYLTKPHHAAHISSRWQSLQAGSCFPNAQQGRAPSVADRPAHIKDVIALVPGRCGPNANSAAP
jgi:hypothetical protein